MTNSSDNKQADKQTNKQTNKQVCVHLSVHAMLPGKGLCPSEIVLSQQRGQLVLWVSLHQMHHTQAEGRRGGGGRGGEGGGG